MEKNNGGFCNDEFNTALSRMIISASGWRGVFAADGNEESDTPSISAAHAAIVSTAAAAFAAYLKKTHSMKQPFVITGIDARPTGMAVAKALIAALKREGCVVQHTGVIAVPEIMSYARSLGNCAFVYISASHNPIGHNGIKFGLCDGGVLAPEEAAALIAIFKTLCTHFKYTGNPPPAYEFPPSDNGKISAEKAYTAFTSEVISGEHDGAKQEAVLQQLRAAFALRPLGIAADFNGSARAVSIDRAYFQNLGIRFSAINERAGQIAHRIVPEGESLEPCRQFLEKLHTRDSAYILGYVPDCDGDRGNLVIWDAVRGAARALEAQEVFALAVYAELRFLAARNVDMSRVAVAVNDPTSMRVDEIAGRFGARVARAEVGEANVVALARKLQQEGWTVRPLGEGAAGGVIIHPSCVRDPLDTIGALLKLLSAGETLEVALVDIPQWTTTGAYSEGAVLKITTPEHGLLKERYRRIFLREWEAKRNMLREKYGITSWRSFRYNGIEECETVVFSDAGRGGLKIVFYDECAAARAALWMRGSGTEPVFRIMADVKGGDTAFETGLLDWQRAMVLEADSLDVE
ncbi:MAG: phosphatidylglycerol lysyltransferase [Spirochaetaceae bacterium]|nr:phosphatidylglycerol lysyltransferase [Spirochaetaceae bacterium]